MINTLDIWTTYRGVKSGKARETNPLLPEVPKLGELVIFKVVWGDIILTTFSEEEMDLANGIVTIAVINNLNVLHNIDEL